MVILYGTNILFSILESNYKIIGLMLSHFNTKYKTPTSAHYNVFIIRFFVVFVLSQLP